MTTTKTYTEQTVLPYIITIRIGMEHVGQEIISQVVGIKIIHTGMVLVATIINTGRCTSNEHTIKTNEITIYPT
jgi:hypothetical protein